jgi:CRISPR-associated protein Csm3
MAFAKIQITGKLVLESGLHIGGSDAFAAIGATDSSVVKDPLSGLPVIPGSSIKGKMRTLLARKLGSESGEIYKKAADDPKEIQRLFGKANGKQNGKQESGIWGRLVFTDLVMSGEERQRLNDRGAKTVTEIKFENTIDRITAQATPRQIERVIRGAEFDFSLVYELEDEGEFEEDAANIVDGLKLLTYDYLGGSGTRGYGSIKFKELKAKTVVGEGSFSDKLTERLKEVS